MASHGIRDRVAIVGMGCTPFGEHWDKSADDLLIDAATEAIASAGVSKDDVDAYWLGTMGSGVQRPHAEPAAEDRLQAGHPGREHLRHRLRGVPQRLLRGGVGRLSTWRWPSASRSSRTAASPASSVAPPPTTAPRPPITAPGAFSLLAPAYSKKYGVDPDEMKDVLTRIAWKNHRNGALEPPRAQFNARGAQGDDRLLSPLVAGQLGIFDCSGVSDGSAAAIIVRAEDAHRYTDHPLYVKALSFVAGPAPGRSTRATTTPPSPRWSRRPQDAYHQAGHHRSPGASSRMAEVHDCFTPTELVLMEDLGFAERGFAWKEVLAGTSTSTASCRSTPTAASSRLRPPVGVDRQLAVEVERAGEHLLQAMPRSANPRFLHQHRFGRREAWSDLGHRQLRPRSVIPAWW